MLPFCVCSMEMHTKLLSSVPNIAITNAMDFLSMVARTESYMQTLPLADNMLEATIQ